MVNKGISVYMSWDVGVEGEIERIAAIIAWVIYDKRFVMKEKEEKECVCGYK